MNIFLDKSLPKKTRILLQMLRVVLIILIFGGFFAASFFPAAQDALLYVSIGIMVVFIIIKIVIERRKRLNNVSIAQGSDTTMMPRSTEADNKK